MRRFLRRGVIGLISLFMISAAWVVWDLRGIKTDIAHMDAVALPLMTEGIQLGTLVARSQAELYRYKSGDTAYIEDLITAVEQLGALIEQLVQTEEIGQIGVSMMELQPLLERYRQQVSEAVTALDRDVSRDLARAAFQQGLLIQQIAAEIEDAVYAHVTADNSSMVSSVRRTTWSITLSLMLFVVAAFIVGRWVFDRTMQPIGSLVQATNAVADDKLNQPVHWEHDDELGQLVDAYNHMLEHVRTSRRELEERNWQLNTLHEINAALKSSVDLQEVLGFILQGVTHGLGFKAAQLFLLNRDTQCLELSLWVGTSSPSVDVAIPITDDHPLIHTLLSPEPVQASVSDPSDPLHTLGDRCLIVPLVGRKEWRCWERHDCQQHECTAYQSPALHCWMLGEKPCDHSDPSHTGRSLTRCVACDVFSTVGVLAIAIPEDRELAHQHQDILVTFADQAGLAVETAQIYRYLQQFNEDLEEQVAASTQHLMETREQLYQSEKLAAIGRLAAGVAHEINNPLAAISTYAQSLLMDIDEPSARKELESIRGEVRRASDITRDLLEFARPKPQQYELVDMHDCVDTAIELARYEADFKHVIVLRHLECQHPIVLGNPRQLQEVLLNLLLNAGQAMDGEGRLVISTMSSANQEKGMEIHIADTGPGVPEDVRPHIFEPFYTTKEVGQGTGLGLYLSYWIAERHGGSLEVKGSSNGGATFVLRLPQEAQHG